MFNNFPVHLLVKRSEGSCLKSKDEVIEELEIENKKLKDKISTLESNRIISIFNFISMSIAFVLCIVLLVLF